MPPVHRRTRSTTSEDDPENGTNFSTTSPVTSTNTSDIDNTGQVLIPASSHETTQIMMSHFTTMSKNFNHQFTILSDHFNQQVATQTTVIQTLLETVKMTQAQVSTTAQSIADPEKEFGDLCLQTNNLAPTSKITDLEKEICNLQLASGPDP